MNDEELRKRRYLRQIYFGEAMRDAGDTGLKFERGIWTPETDIADTYIYFNESHDEAPFYYCIYNASDEYSDVLNSNFLTSVLDYYSIDEKRLWATSSIYNYGVATFVFRGTSSTSLSGTYSNMQESTIRQFARSDSIRAYTNTATRYWRAGVQYEWLAVWMSE